MKRGQVLFDAGPLVAVVSRDDANHERCVEELAELPTPLLTCWPVVAEALWLVGGTPRRSPASSAALPMASGRWSQWGPNPCPGSKLS